MFIPLFEGARAAELLANDGRLFAAETSDA
jgi:hypothetical protein